MNSSLHHNSASKAACRTPVALIFFNRPDKVEAVLKRLQEVRPPELFLIADGPREGVPEDADRCFRTREVVESLINWDCNVYRNYALTNLGCGPRPASGISWVFRCVERAIILEDDCIPDPSFFYYCDELLERYKDDHRVMQICGTNYFPEETAHETSYFFSRYLVSWGWASWRRAWEHFDYDMHGYDDETAMHLLRRTFERESSVQFWKRQLDRTIAGDHSVWDLRWLYAGWKQGGYGIIPTNNLVSNIGFGEDSTHTAAHVDGGFTPTRPVNFPLVHPPEVRRDQAWDQKAERDHFTRPARWRTVKQVLRWLAPDPLLQRYRRSRSHRRRTHTAS
jgi:hypothetical protein